jgi:hypothetical protein
MVKGLGIEGLKGQSGAVVVVEQSVMKGRRTAKTASGEQWLDRPGLRDLLRK